MNQIKGSLFILVFLFTMLTGTKAAAQHLISNIEINPLKRTQQDYLFRFIDSKVGESIDLEKLDNDLQRLKNLNAIVNGSYTLDTINQQVDIQFHLQEGLTLFPLINFGGVKGNFWYQVGINDDNWQGRGQKLTVFYQNNDKRHNYNIYYKIPQFKRSKWGGSVSAFRWASVEPLYFSDEVVFYDYDNISLGLTSMYRLNRTSAFEFGGTYFVETYRKNKRHDDIQTSGPSSLRQAKFLAKAIHLSSKIKYHYYFLDGFDNSFSLQGVYNFYDQSRFYILLNDIRYFIRFKDKGNFAARLRVGLATNKNSPFAPFVLDSYVNIRGSGNRIERGTAALVFNAEYRYTIFENKRFASQLVAFSDTGTWRDPGGSLEDIVDEDSLQLFVGGGLRLIYKEAYNLIFRLDYGVDAKDIDRRGLVLGIGQYF